MKPICKICPQLMEYGVTEDGTYVFICINDPTHRFELSHCVIKPANGEINEVTA